MDVVDAAAEDGPPARELVLVPAARDEYEAENGTGCGWDWCWAERVLVDGGGTLDSLGRDRLVEVEGEDLETNPHEGLEEGDEDGI